jgi:hypothetical protein
LLANERKRIGKAWIDKKGEKEKRTKKKKQRALQKLMQALRQ